MFIAITATVIMCTSYTKELGNIKYRSANSIAVLCERASTESARVGSGTCLASRPPQTDHN